MKTLDEIGLQYNSDKSSNFHNYLNLYEKYFSEIRFKENIILEIGILYGDSLKIFSDYFENSKIIGIDIFDKSYLKIKNCETIIGDQGDRNFLNSLPNNYDIIIDDGSHKMNHQQISFGCLFKKLKSGGIYIIEDLHTSLPNYIETINNGKDLFGLNEFNDNNTIDFLKGNKNYYLTNDELDYVSKNVNFIDIIQTAFRNENNLSITSIIIKK